MLLIGGITRFSINSHARTGWKRAKHQRANHASAHNETMDIRFHPGNKRPATASENPTFRPSKFPRQKEFGKRPEPTLAIFLSLRHSVFAGTLPFPMVFSSQIRFPILFPEIQANLYPRTTRNRRFNVERSLKTS